MMTCHSRSFVFMGFLRCVLMGSGDAIVPPGESAFSVASRRVHGKKICLVGLINADMTSYQRFTWNS